MIQPKGWWTCMVCFKMFEKQLLHYMVFVLSTWWLENGFDQGFSLMGFGNQTLMRFFWWVQEAKIYNFWASLCVMIWIVQACGKLLRGLKKDFEFINV